MHRSTKIFAAALPLAAAITLIAPNAYAATTHVTPSAPHGAASCDAIAVPAPAGSKIVSVTAVAKPGGTLQFPVPLGGTDLPAPVTGVPEYCQLDVTLTHDGTDHELIEVWLPARKAAWNGRFEALGGSGYAAGDFNTDLANAVKQGYAVGTQNSGLTPETGWTAPWALTADGTVDRTLLANFASRGPHELSVVAENAIRAYYGRAADYSYWNGCSTGGRQGLVEAQQYPKDFDGILAAAPAVSWDKFAPADLWPYVVENEQHDKPTAAEFAAFDAAAIARGDVLDGSADGLSEKPFANDFDPYSIVGQTVVNADGSTGAISRADAEVVKRIWAGPVDAQGERLWYGIPKGADFSYLAGDYAPFTVAGDWIASFVEKNPGYDLSSIGYAQFEKIFEQSVAEYHGIIGSDSTDLRDFDKAGGKLITWQGTADQLIPIGGTKAYYDGVAAAKQHGHDQVADYYRLFFVPGASHCAPGDGPAPTDPLGALERWVERGQAPATLAADGTLADGRTVHEMVPAYRAPLSAHHGR
jgi:hypothetical protein